MEKNHQAKELRKKFNIKKILLLLILVSFIAFVVAPALVEIYSSSSQGIFNRTEASDIGIRLSAPVLFMDFNTPPEIMPVSPYNGPQNITGMYAPDSSLHGSTGIISGYLNDTNWRNVGSQVNNSLQFDGVDDYVAIANGYTAAENESRTVSFWLNKRSQKIYANLFSLSTFNFVAILDSATDLGIYKHDGNYFSSKRPMPLDTWYHFLYTYNGSNQNCSIYVNGTFVNSSIFGLTAGSLYRIGSSAANGFIFNGSIDEFMYFNRTLSASEAADLYANQSIGLRTLETDSDLVGYWHLDELVGTATVDSAAGKSNGTLNGYPALSTPSYNSTGGYDGSGAYTFDGVDDFISAGTTQGGSYNTTALWYKNSTATTWTFGVWLSNGTNYSNGIAVNPSQKPFKFRGAGIWIGNLSSGNFNGTIDNVQVWNRDLSLDEIVCLYNGTGSGCLGRANSSYIGKYSLRGDYSPFIFYNSSAVSWNITLAIADTYSSHSGIVNTDNTINVSNPYLVSYWALDRNYADATGRGNGTCINSSCPSNATGLSSGAMRFDGVDDFINTTNNVSFNISQSFTFSVWAKMSSFTASRPIFGKLGPNYEYFLSTQNTTNALRFGYYGIDNLAAISYVSNTNSSVLTNNWAHVVVVWNGTNKMGAMYINGRLDTNGTNATSFPLVQRTESVAIGASYHYSAATTAYFPGLIDEFIIYNTSISAGEVDALYKSGLSQHATTNITMQYRLGNAYNTTDPSLVAFWSFNRDNETGVANRAVDETGKNNGTRNGAISDANEGNGTIGKGYYFDGSDDKINMTISFTSAGLNSTSLWIFSSSANAWQHIAYNGTTYFLNGVVGSVANYPLNRSGNVFSIGINVTGGAFFAGSIDEVRIYNRTLSAPEILDLYNLGKTHINWTGGDASGWSSAGILLDGAVNTTNTTGRFMQFKNNFYSNDTSASPYLINYSVFGFDASPPNATLNTPVNASYLNASSQNLTANLSDIGLGIKNATLNVIGTSGNRWLQFDGVNDYVSLGTSFGKPDNWTIAYWIKFNRVTQCAPVLSTAGGTPSILSWGVWHLGSPNGFSPTISNGSDYNTLNSNISPSNNVWTFVAATVNGTALSYYHNGVLSNISGRTISNSGTVYGLSIGRPGESANYYCNGSMDEVRIYNRSLSAAEILAIYNNQFTSNASIVNTSGLMGYYDFQSSNSTNTLAIDVGTGTRNGTIFGGAVFTSNEAYAIGFISFAANTLTATVGVVINFVDGVYNWFYDLFDWAGNQFTTTNNTLTIDTTYPQISFGTGTENNGVNKSQNFTYINVTWTETNLANITFEIYNSTGLKNSTVYTTANYYINFTNLADGNYSYNVTICDKTSKCNFTETRKITLDTTAPNATLLTPANNSFLNYSSLNLTVNLSDNIGIKNTTLYVYNTTGLYNQTWLAQSDLGYAVQFNGSNYFTTAAGISKTDNWTIAVWAYPNGSSPSTNIISLNNILGEGNSLGVFSIGRGIVSGADKIWLHWFNGSQVGLGVDYNNNSWNFIVAERKGSNFTIRNMNTGGINSTTSWGDATFSISLLRIGGGSFGTTWNNGGKIDDIVYWTRALSDAEINEIYNSGSGWKLIPTNAFSSSGMLINDSLYALWHFNDGNESNARDSYQGTYNGTGVGITNSSWTVGIVPNPVFSPGTLTSIIGIIITFVDGVYDWFYSLFDWAGNSFTTANRTMTIDANLPSGTILSPQNDTINTTSRLQNFSINCTDSLGLMNATLYVYNQTGLYNLTEIIINTTIGTKVYLASIVINMTEGAYNWFWQIRDSASNLFDTRTSEGNRTYFIDAIKPVITPVFPLNDGIYNYIPATLNYTSSDSISGLDKCWYSLLGSNSSFYACNSPFSIDSSYVIEGENFWIFYAKDRAGNVQNASVNFTVHTAAPSISFGTGSAASGNYSTSSMFTNVTSSGSLWANITFDIYNDTSLYYSVFSDTSQTISNTLIGMAEATYYINATAWDLAMNSNTTETRIVRLDRTKPLVSFGTGVQVDYANVSARSIYANVSVTELYEKNITFTLSNSTGVVNSTVFTTRQRTINWSVGYDDAFNYSVSVCDYSGNCNTTVVRKIIIDSSGPLFSSVYSTAGTTSIDLYATVSDLPSGISSIIVQLYNGSGSYINSYPMSILSGNALSGTYIATIPGLSSGADYLAVINTSDSLNTYTSYNYNFDMYSATSFSLNASFDNMYSSANLTFYKPGTSSILVSNYTNSSFYSFSANQRIYDLNLTMTNYSIFFRSINISQNASLLVQSPSNSNNAANISLYKILSILAVQLDNMTLGGNATIEMKYSFPSDVLAITESGLTMHKCSSWSFSSKACTSSYSLYSEKSIDTSADIITINVTGFSAYLITGSTCGGHGCQPEYGETSSNCPADCSTGGSITGGATGGGGGGGVTTAVPVSVSTTEILKEVTIGESDSYTITLTNSKTYETKAELSMEGDIELVSSFANKTINVPASGTAYVIYNIVGVKEGYYSGKIFIKSDGVTTSIPVKIIILSKKDKLLDLTVRLEEKTISPGDELAFGLGIFNLGKLNRYDVNINYDVINLKTNKSIVNKQEAVAIETSLNLARTLLIPKDAEEGEYNLVVKAFYGTMYATATSKFELKKMFKLPAIIRDYLPLFISLAFLIILAGALIYYFSYVRKKLLEKELEEIKKKSPYVFPDFKSLPKSKYAYIGLIADTRVKTYLDYTQLNRHVLIAGGTGSGKTIAGMDIAEELAKREVSVLVFDPVGQWSGFFNKNNDKTMVSKYKKFGMGSPRKFDGKIIEINENTINIDIASYARSGEFIIFKLDKIPPRLMDQFIDRCLSRIYHANFSESSTLKTLLVFDEVHRLLPKYGGKGAYTKLEQAVREFRKWGIGLLMISQVLTDFKGAIRGNIGTEVQMFTRYEGDIKRVRERHGSKISGLVSQLPTGVGIVEAAGYNRGGPYFVEFRPILHSPLKLTDEEVKKYLEKNPALTNSSIEEGGGEIKHKARKKEHHATHTTHAEHSAKPAKHTTHSAVREALKKQAEAKKQQKQDESNLSVKEIAARERKRRKEAAEKARQRNKEEEKRHKIIKKEFKVK